ncbi:DVU_1555 family C-GCAxxG-C-C protein [Maridesulfovibrio bastinii]|uniref:DVU_1555 family C-GCAxxG-C-C protein n=1 Tax=Maridesulfovibrio bastinii TaxID=47157 RepID=UPI0003F5FF85|nr:DV_1555 family C-GCAxxG-C-C protein [Maridesulfovibrio bastinii]
MDDTSLKIMQLSAQGFCCSQMMIMMALEDQGEENPALVRSMSALCQGIGQSGGICGAVSGGACVLGLYAAKGSPDEEEHEKYKLMVSELMDWFENMTSDEYGGATCDAITGGANVPEMGICGTIVERTRNKVLELLAENDIDPTVPKGSENAF